MKPIPDNPHRNHSDDVMLIEELQTEIKELQEMNKDLKNIITDLKWQLIGIEESNNL